LNESVRLYSAAIEQMKSVTRVTDLTFARNALVDSSLILGIMKLINLETSDDDISDAIDLIKRAQQYDHPFANFVLYSLIPMLFEIEDIDDLFEQCEEDFYSRLLLGLAHFFGIGVGHSFRKALDIVSHDLQDPMVSAFFALCCHCGFGLPQSESDAFRLVLQSAGRGLVQPQVAAGLCYLYGIGTESSILEANEWFYSAQNNGADLPSRLFDQSALQQLNDIDFLEEQSSSGDPKWYFRIGRALENSDPVRAFEMYKKSAESGYHPAICRMPSLYAEGIGVRKDLHQAAVWSVVCHLCSCLPPAFTLSLDVTPEVRTDAIEIYFNSILGFDDLLDDFSDSIDRWHFLAGVVLSHM